MDYKELLKKYMKYIRYEEGIDFVENGRGWNVEKAKITDEEWEILKKISDRI
jgi:glutathione synthase/RimK-type ligase-like ATP-grasp enzyme